jgi:hypothetical protein
MTIYLLYVAFDLHSVAGINLRPNTYKLHKDQPIIKKTPIVMPRGRSLRHLSRHSHMSYEKRYISGLIHFLST